MNRNFWKVLLSGFLLLIWSAAYAGTIERPTENFVFQQDSNGEAAFRVTWRGDADSLEIKNGSTVIATSTDGNFYEIDAGWYDLNLIDNGQITDTIKIGVGDVYATPGQSNATASNQPANYVPDAVPPGRVIVSDYYRQGFWKFRDLGVDPLSGQPECCVTWEYFAMALNRPYPIMIVNISQGGTTAYQWANSLGTRLIDALVITRPKAWILVHGESDSALGTSQQSYFSDWNAIIASLRAISTTPWVICINSYNPPNLYIRSAQQDLIAAWPHAFYGPLLDGFRVANPAEFMGDEMRQVGEAIAASVLALGL